MQRFSLRHVSAVAGVLLVSVVVLIGPAVRADDAIANETLNTDSTLVRDLDRLDDFIARERWHEVATGLQSILDRPGDSFIRVRNDWVSIRTRVESRIRSLPETGLRTYHTLYDGIAQDLVQRAEATQDQSLLVTASQRFSVTDAGARANCELANLSFNRGEFVAAARFYRQLDERQQKSVMRPTERMRFVAALNKIGRGKDAISMASTLPETARDGLEKFARPQSPQTVPQRDWPMVFGGASGFASAEGGEPLLSPRWSFPMTNRYAVNEQIRELESDIQDSRRVGLPMMRPIAALGCIAVRTLAGIAVIEGESGEVLWTEPTRDISPDQLLSTVDAPQRFDGRRRRSRGIFSGYNSGGDVDSQPLTSLLYRDAVYGSLSSDGQRLFVVDQHAVLGRATGEYAWSHRDEAPDPYERDWSSNAIAAYELRTGQLLWRVGGVRRNEVFDSPLAGMYFFGPPTPSEGRLYAVGERDGEISLVVLDGPTGQPLTIQSLTSSTTPISHDMARRNWSCQPSVSNGVVICPTTSGWLIAVGQLDGRLLWARRVVTQQTVTERRRFSEVSGHPLHALNVRWAAAPPVMAGSKVLFTPSEAPDAMQSSDSPLYCLELLTGRVLWRYNKTFDDIALGGTDGNTVLVVGRDRLRGLSLENGQSKWNVSLPEEVTPSGHGLVVGEKYFQPLANGQLWSVQLADGEVTRKLTAISEESPLGSLAMSRGQLISVDALKIRGFARQSTVEAEIATRRKSDPEDLWALVRAAEIHQLRGEDEAVVSLLGDRLDLPGTGPEARVSDGDSNEESNENAHTGADDEPRSNVAELEAEGRRILETSLWRLVESDVNGHAAEFERLQRLLAPDSPRLLQLATRRAIAAEDWDRAWQHLKVMQQGDLSALLSQNRVRLRTDVWMGQRLKEIYEKEQSPKSEIDQTLAAAVTDVINRRDQSRAVALQRVACFHPEGHRLTLWLAQQANEAGDLGAAALHWRRLEKWGDAALACRARLELAELWGSHGHIEDAVDWLKSVPADLDTIPHSETRQELASRLTDLQRRWEKEANSDRSHARPDWSDHKFEVHSTRPMDVRITSQPQVPYPATEAFYDSHTFELLEPRTQRLRISSFKEGEFWNLPLQASPRIVPRNSSGMEDDSTPVHSMSPRGSVPSTNEGLGLLTDGLQVYSAFRGVVQSLSLVDRRVRWSMALEPRALRQQMPQPVHDRFNDQVMHPIESFAEIQGISRQTTRTGMLASASATSLFVYGRNELSSVDPLTGELLWVRSEIPAYAMAYGDQGPLLLVSRHWADLQVIDPVDGCSLDREHLVKVLPQAVTVIRNQIIVASQPTGRILGLFRSPVRLQSQDMFTGAVQWEQTIPQNTLVSWLSPETLALLKADGNFQTLDLSTGIMRSLGDVPADVMKSANQFQMVADRDTIALLVEQDVNRTMPYSNGSSTRGSDSSPRVTGVSRTVPYFNVPSLRVNGVVLGFDRHEDQGLIWQHQLKDQNLLLPHLNRLPVFVFFSQVHDNAGFFQCKLVLLDKRTGRELLATDSLVTPNQLQQFQIDLVNSRILLHMYNIRLEVRPAIPTSDQHSTPRKSSSP